MTVRRGHDAANAWLALSGIALGLATLYALAVVTFRLPVFSGDNRLLFRTALVLHVELAVFVWLMTTMAARWSALPAHRTGWLPPGIAAAGTFLLAMSPLAGGTPVMLDYFPILADNRLFILGFGLICAGILLAALTALWSSASDDTSRAAAWATLMALLAALTTYLHPAAGIADIAWAAGHTLLFAHVIMLIGEWPRHAGVPLPAKGTRWLVVSATLLPWIPLAAPPGSPLFLSLYSQSMILLLWPPALWVIVRLAVSSNVAAPPFGRLTLTLSMSFFVVCCLLGSRGVHAQGFCPLMSSAGKLTSFTI